MDKLRIAIIGYGYWGPNLVRNFWKNSQCIVTHVVDFDKNRLKSVNEDYPSINTKNTFEEILNDKSIDCIGIATPVHTHYELVKKSLQKKKHVFVEKPLTHSYKKARELIKLAKEKRCVLFVDNTYLYTPAVQELYKQVKSNNIGNIQYIDSTRINLGKFQSHVNVLWDLATHDISICLYLMQEKPNFIQAIGQSHTKSGLEDIAYLTMHFGSNKIAHFNCSWISPVKIRHMLIGGTKKMIVFNDLESTEKVKIYDSGYKEKPILTQPNKFLADYRIGDVFSPKLEMTEGLVNVVKDFVLSIKKKKKPVSNNELSLMIVNILECAEMSIKNNGKKVKIT